MKRWILPLCLAAVVAAGASRLSARDNSFKTRIFGDTPNVVVRGVPAAGNPWVTDNSRVKLEPNGDLDIRIRGLVIAPGLNAAGLPVNPNVVGTNPVGQVTIAVTWAVPQAVSPTGIFIQQTPLLPLSPEGDLQARLNIGPPPPGAERPIILVRAFGGPYIALSDFVSDLGDAHPQDFRED